MHCGPHCSQGEAARAAPAELGDPLVNPMDVDWHEQNRQRRHKFGAWVTKPGSLGDMLIGCVSMQPQVELLAELRAADSDKAIRARMSALLPSPGPMADIRRLSS